MHTHVTSAPGRARSTAHPLRRVFLMKPDQHIIVDLDSGVAVGITQPPDQSLRVGDAVRIEGSGPDARVVRR